MVPGCVSASSSSTSLPASARARATARPPTPAPITTHPTRSAISAGSRLQDFARVHDAVRIERLLERAHEFELHRRRVAFELEYLELADAMFGAEAAIELAHQVVDGTLCLLLHRLQLRGLRARTLVDVEVQVAVSEM